MHLHHSSVSHRPSAMILILVSINGTMSLIALMVSEIWVTSAKLILKNKWRESITREINIDRYGGLKICLFLHLSHFLGLASNILCSFAVHWFFFNHGLQIQTIVRSFSPKTGIEVD